MHRHLDDPPLDSPALGQPGQSFCGGCPGESSGGRFIQVPVPLGPCEQFSGASDSYDYLRNCWYSGLLWVGVGRVDIQIISQQLFYHEHTSHIFALMGDNSIVQFPLSYILKRDHSMVSLSHLFFCVCANRSWWSDIFTKS